MIFHNPNYKPARQVYCQYCGSRNVIWVQRHDRERRLQWRLVDKDTNDFHYLTCTSRRESVNSQKPL